MLRLLTLLFLIGTLSACVEEHKPIQPNFDKAEHFESIPESEVQADTVTISKDEYMRLVRMNKPDKSNGEFSFTYILMSWGLYIAYYVAGIIISLFVYRDAKKQEVLSMNINPFWWAVLTVIHAPLGLLAYWMIHHSRFSVEKGGSREDAI